MLTSRRPNGKGAAGRSNRCGDSGSAPESGSFLLKKTEAIGRYLFRHRELNIEFHWLRSGVFLTSARCG